MKDYVETAVDIRAETEEILPQWPGHTPRRRWEWMVRAHRVGAGWHVWDAKPSVDLKTEQEVRAFVLAALGCYDTVRLHHWYSGTELTFTRQADGSTGVARRQLRPTDGSPLRAAYDAAEDVIDWERNGDNE